MKMGNYIWQKSFVGLSALVVVSSLSVTSAFADGNTSSSTGSVTTTVTAPNRFTTKYDNNMAQENSLLAQAQSGNPTSDAQVAALISTAQTLNTQTAALYTSEQALLAAESSIPQVSTLNNTPSQLTQLENERNDILAKSLKDWEWLLQFVHNPHDRGQLNQALHAHAGILKQLSDVNKKIADIKDKKHSEDHHQSDRKHPYDNGLSQLQHSILTLQASAMKYTETAILLEQNLAAGSSTSGSTYGSGLVTNGWSNGSGFLSFGNFDF